MKISAFMVPANQVASCQVNDSLRVAVDAMLEKQVGAIVVLDSEKCCPVGFFTKSDILEAYNKALPLDTLVSDIMQKELQCLKKDESKEEAAKFFEKNKIHHAIVTDNNGHFVGLISTWDICADTAGDSRAWPWTKSADGRFHHPFKSEGIAAQSSPTSVHRDSKTFEHYIDSVRELPFMDD